ncbi:MAG: 4-alpha-glucanotransferase [Lachnospiraceae bacterium]|nr:4-alpha-glucanotransferase [Lachnospiraceae bacterium]
MRQSGILMAVSSIPSKYGIGSFSKEAYAFVDFLEKAGQKLWQILPLGPTGYGDSPYQSFSTFAGNPYFIDLETLITEGYLTEEDCEACDFGDDETSVDYEKVYNARFKVLYTAYKNSSIEENEEFLQFCRENDYWLADYALYMAVKNSFGGKSWTLWDEDIKLRRPQAVAAYQEKFADEILFYEFQQFMFVKQWQALKAYANGKKIKIVGDIPIYVALDSADTWANPELFQLDDTCTPTAVAGCPPDAFSATGQLWGNPLYRWEYHKQTGYQWWIQRIAYCYKLYDIVRIDHFRGFDEYYSIPYGDETAENGHWEPGPGYDIFRALKARLGKIEVIAEDLGFLTKSVIRLVKKTGYPGMKILQFAFDSREESDYLPHNYTSNCVVYTGTHDNDTTVSWYGELNRSDKRLAKKYLDIHSTKEIQWVFIRSALSSVADTAVIPMQDYLGLGGEARMNMPSTLGTNWKWRMKPDACTDELAQRIRDMVKLYGRL